MTSHDEQRLSDALRRQAASQDPHLLSLDDVTSRARGIRRRRVAAGVVAAAAVVAVVVPTALVAADRTDGTTPNVATQTPNATATVDPTRTVTPTDEHVTVQVVGDLPTGPAPSVGVRIMEDVVTPDGTRIKVGTNARYFSPLGEDWVSLEASDDGTATFQVRSADGTLELEQPANPDGALAVSPDRTVAAYLATDGRIHTYSATDGDLTFSESMDNVLLEAVQGSGSCKEQSPEGGGCTVYFDDGQGGTGYADSHGIVDSLDFLGLGGFSAHAVVGMVSAKDDGSCSQARDLASDRVLWRTCDSLPETWSPDGRFLTAGPAYGDGPGPSRMEILDGSTGRSLVTLDANTSAGQMSYIHQVVWEDDDHVLALVFTGKAWTMVRVGLDGSAELADTGRIPGNDPSVFSAGLPLAP